MGDGPHQSDSHRRGKLVREGIVEEEGPESQKTFLGVQKYTLQKVDCT